MSTSRKTVLVTGANGYLATAVVQHFLDHGYHVRGTVRSLAKADGLKAALWPKYAQALSFVAVSDMTRDGAYESTSALEGIDAVLHVASPIPDLTTAGNAHADYVHDMIDPAVLGSLNVLKAAAKYPRITHVVMTSSMAAVRGAAQGRDLKSTGLSEDDWNPATRHDSDVNSNAMNGYYASKAEAERAAWEYVRAAKPHYVFATFCPPFFFGPAGCQPSSPRELGSTLGMFYGLTKGRLPGFSMDGNYVDVRDLAAAYRLVIEKPLSAHERFVIANGAHSHDELVRFASTLDPAVLQETPTTIDTHKVQRVLGWKPRSKRETFVDMADWLKEAEKNFTN